MDVSRGRDAGPAGGRRRLRAGLLIQEKRVRAQAVAAQDAVPPPRNTGVVPSSWLMASGTWSTKSMLDTLRLVEARHVDPKDIPAVMEIYEEVTGVKPAGVGAFVGVAA